MSSFFVCLELISGYVDVSSVFLVSQSNLFMAAYCSPVQAQRKIFSVLFKVGH